MDEPAPQLSEADPRFSDGFKDFVHACLVKDYDRRPRYQALLDHPFLVDYRSNTDKYQEPILRFVRKVSHTQLLVVFLPPNIRDLSTNL